jgi:lipid A 3-O-deacylase
MSQPGTKARQHIKLALRAFLASALALLPAVLWETARAADSSQDQADDDTHVSLTLDNDFFAGYDQHYTNGFQIAFSPRRESLPEAIRSLPPFRWSAEPRYTFAIGQRIYTPNDKSLAVPDPLDRPYAGWLYALVDVRTKTGPVVDSVQASIGVIGPASHAEQTQNGYHRLIGSDQAKGWDSQLDNKLGLLLGYERMWPKLMTGKLAGLDLDFTPRTGATIGNVYTYANAGGVIRLGRNLPDDFPLTNISLGPPRDGYRPSQGTPFGWYAWLGTDARLVGWNAFLDTDTSAEGAGIKRKSLGLDLQLGAAVVLGKSRAGFTFVRRSKEFETQAKPDNFGQLSVSFAF